jgi:hypothetical protein
MIPMVFTLPLWRWYLFGCHDTRQTCELLVVLSVAGFPGSLGTHSRPCRHICGVLELGTDKNFLWSPPLPHALLHCSMVVCVYRQCISSQINYLVYTFLNVRGPIQLYLVNVQSICLHAIGLSWQTFQTESCDFRNFVTFCGKGLHHVP